MERERERGVERESARWIQREKERERTGVPSPATAEEAPATVLRRRSELGVEGREVT